MDTIFENCQVEWPLGMHKHFIPDSDLKSVTTIKNVQTELRGLHPNLDPVAIYNYAEQICSKAFRLFAILISMEKKAAICEFLDDGICDTDLPFIRLPHDQLPKLYVASHKDCPKQDHTSCSIQAFSNQSIWTQRAVGIFCRDQWVAQAPVFKDGGPNEIPHYKFEDTVVLPYVEDHARDSEDKGGYGMVWRIRVHAAHQKLYVSTDDRVKEPLLAIKQPFSKKRELFQKERDMLSTLATKNHAHLIQLLATYEHNGSFHFMFPFANANLRVYWEETGVPYWNEETYLWFIHQICGLASGLDNIHEFNATKSPLGGELTNARAKAAFGKYLAVEDGEEKFGRHGDIKPENILWFNEWPQAGEEGVLQITDMGLGRFHRLDSRSKVTAHFIGGSPTYMPPEVLLQKLASRAYDIWSMGCVFLEFITWLLEGPQAVEEFTEARGMTAWDGTYDDVYFTVVAGENDKNATVRKGVTSWFGRLRKHPRCSPMVAELLTIVENQMLVVKSKHRVRSSILVRNLQSLYTKALGSSQYLLGEDVSASDAGKGVKIPSGPKTLYATPRRPSDQSLDRMPNSSPPRASTHSIEIVLPDGHLEEPVEPPLHEKAFVQESLPPTQQPPPFSTPVPRFTSFGLNQKRRRHSNPYE